MAKASNASFTLHMDKYLLAQAEIMFKLLGLDLSTATALFYRQALQCRGLPFSVKLSEENFEVPNEQTLDAMDEAERMLNDPTARRFHSIEELKADLERP